MTRSDSDNDASLRKESDLILVCPQVLINKSTVVKLLTIEAVR